MDSELDGFDCFEFGLLDEVIYILLRHPVILIIEEKFLSLHVFLILLGFIFFIDDLPLLLYLVLVNLQELLSDPSVVSTVNAKVVNVVFIPHTVKHFLLGDLLLVSCVFLSIHHFDIVILTFFLFFSRCLGFLLLLEFINKLSDVGHTILFV